MRQGFSHPGAEFIDCAAHLLIPRLCLQSRQDLQGSQQAEIRIFGQGQGSEQLINHEMRWPTTLTDQLTIFNGDDGAAEPCACISRSAFRGDAGA